MTRTVPDRTQVLVVGGGPAGSTAATLLARQGIDVVCLEKDRFPRYHIGESLLPSALEMFDLLGVREKVEAGGFVRKPGAVVDWGRERWRLDFGELSGDHVHSFQVERAEFDRLLLDHSRSQGAQVFEGHQVTALEAEDGRYRRASWSNEAGETGAVDFDVVVDASGRAGLISTTYQRNRTYHAAFKNIAVWGYWEGVDPGDAGFLGAIHVSSIPDGWVWVIPLQGGRTSIGVVVHRDYFQAQRGRGAASIYRSCLGQSDYVSAMIAPGRLASDLGVETDYSYGSSSFSGDGYFVCGDAACFLDPLLSTGVHLAMFSALVASAAIGSTLRGDLPEERCRHYFEVSYRKAYLRLLMMVSAFYDQNRGQRGYFWEAQRLTGGDVEGFDLKQAFLSLVTGTEDLGDAARGLDLETLQSVVKERLEESLSLRQDKEVLAAMHAEGAGEGRLEASASFMHQVEGLFVLGAGESVDNMRLVATPRLGLAESVASTV